MKISKIWKKICHNFVPDCDYSKTHTNIEHNFLSYNQKNIFGLENAENIANFSMYDES